MAERAPKENPDPAAGRDDYLDRAALIAYQRDRLRSLLQEILPRNRFYARKLADVSFDSRGFDGPAALAQLPFTTKAELIADQQQTPPYGRVLTYPPSRYSRLHQTSGTSGQPLRWLDTPGSWSWLLDCWDVMYRMAGVTPADRLFFPFSFGPFLGFWTAFDAAARLGCLCLPGGGMSSAARLRFLLDMEATVVLATPTYALRLAEVARTEGIDLAASPVRLLIVAGEPGGSIPATRSRVEQSWNARVIDHCGLTEIGAVGIECVENPAGLHVLETQYVAEVIEPATGQPAAPGAVGELVLTNLGRWGSPLLRYRTGDLVRVDTRPCPCGRSFVRLDGGILGRADDMIHVRGNNFYPSTLEGVIRRFAQVAEYRVTIDRSGALTQVRVEIEPTVPELRPDLAERISQAIRAELLFRAEVAVVPPGTLPRFEMKSARVLRA
jgi:phenylacetate-CoA ligase